MSWQALSCAASSARCRCCLIVSLITFGMMRLIPGDPSSIIGGMSATPEQLAQIRTDLGLDEPFHGAAAAGGTAGCCRAILGAPS